jgi:hypothetical protein
LAAKGRIDGIATPEGIEVPPEIGRDIEWSLAATAARNGSTIDLTRLSAEGAGLVLAGSGQLTEGGAIEGRLHLAIADLRPFSGLVGHPLAGTIELEANAAREGAAGFKAKLDGSAKALRTGIAAADALLGGSATMIGSVERDPAGTVILDRLAIAGSAAKLSGDARFDPASNRLAAAFALDLPRLKPLGAALGTEMAGAISARLTSEGTLDRLRLTSEIEGGDIAAGGAKIDRLRLAANIADLSERRATLDSSLRAYGLDGTLALAAELKENSELVIPRLRMTAAESTVEGSLRIALDTGLIRGSITGRSPDLARWSRLAGTPLGGAFELGAGLDAHGGQLLDLSLNGTRLTAGAGSSHIGVGRLALTARFGDILLNAVGDGASFTDLGELWRERARVCNIGARCTATRPFHVPRRCQRSSVDSGARGRGRGRTWPGGAASDPAHRVARERPHTPRTAAYAVKTWRRSRLFRPCFGFRDGSDHRQWRGAR